MKREGINYPKFTDKFARMDFEADPMPVLCLYPIPERIALEHLSLEVCGLEQHPRRVEWGDLARLPEFSLKAPLICQIFNWCETVEWRGIRLVDVLDHFGIETHPEGYYAVASRDGMYFETLSRDEARDPRVLLATGLNGAPLPQQHGGPLRLVAPFLQGYKSVKWVGAIKAYRHNPVGIKRLLGQSRTGQLSTAWKRRFGIEPPAGKTGDSCLEPSAVLAGEARPRQVVTKGDLSHDIRKDAIGSSPASTQWSNARHTIMCEVMAIIRPEKRAAARRALEEVGVIASTSYGVLGRSRQRGLRFPSQEGRRRNGAAIQFLPKLLVMIVVEEPLVSTVIDALMRANRSGTGRFGDGKIFVLEIADTVRLSTAEHGGLALR